MKGPGSQLIPPATLQDLHVYYLVVTRQKPVYPHALNFLKYKYQ